MRSLLPRASGRSCIAKLLLCVPISRNPLELYSSFPGTNDFAYPFRLRHCEFCPRELSIGIRHALPRSDIPVVPDEHVPSAYFNFGDSLMFGLKSRNDADAQLAAIGRSQA